MNKLVILSTVGKGINSLLVDSDPWGGAFDLAE
jgi:hypothetical protein